MSRKRPQRVVVTVRCGGPGRDGAKGGCGREVGWLWRKDGELVYSGACKKVDVFLELTRRGNWFRLDEIADSWALGTCSRCKRFYGFHPDLIKGAIAENRSTVRAPIPDL